MSAAPVEDQAALVGQTLRERYVVTEILGAGSQGATYAAVDKKEGRPVAIKRFQVRGARSWKDVELAEREADVLSGLEHRLLPRAYDRFEDTGALYLVMEKIDGAPLGATQRLDRDAVTHLLADAAEVLDYLHSRHPPVIHRDVKPANFILRPAGTGAANRGRASFVLVDFGSVRARLEPRGGSTVVGTFGYMAPEQLQGRALPATDVYAVGVTALRLLTGVEPEDLPHKGLGIDVAAALPALAAKRDPLVGVLAAMVTPDPDQRPAAIAPLLERLRPAPAPARPERDSARRRAHDDVREAIRRESLERNQEKAWRKKERLERKTRRRFEKERRRADRAARSAARWQRWQTGVRLPWFVRLVFVLVLFVWRVQVAIALGVVVPLALTLLSLFFGERLRRAAERVRHAGHLAGDWLDDVRLRVQGDKPRAARIAASVTPQGGERRASSSGVGNPRSGTDGSPAVTAPPAGMRIDESVHDAIKDAVAEAEAAVDASVREVDEELRRKMTALDEDLRRKLR